jgi:CheY-like chemotaxis protein
MASLASLTAQKKSIVLVVEDESLTRMLAVSILEDEGYAVVEASNADRAIAILSRRADIEIVFTDINMPGSMDGLNLATAIRDRWPLVKLIVTSGKNALSDSDLPTGGRFLNKPYSPLTLIDALTALI